MDDVFEAFKSLYHDQLNDEYNAQDFAFNLLPTKTDTQTQPLHDPATQLLNEAVLHIQCLRDDQKQPKNEQSSSPPPQPSSPSPPKTENIDTSNNKNNNNEEETTTTTTIATSANQEEQQQLQQQQKQQSPPQPSPPPPQLAQPAAASTETSASTTVPTTTEIDANDDHANADDCEEEVKETHVAPATAASAPPSHPPPPTATTTTTTQRYVLRLRGLPWQARKPDIEHFFGAEKVTEIQVIFLTDGRASGEALVEFADNDSFERGLAKNRQHIGHRYIELFKSTGIEMDTAAGRAMRPPVRPPKSQHVLRMRGLPYSATDEDVFAFFEIPQPSGVHLIKDDLGRPSGEGFVEFECEVDAIAAMAKHRHHMAHRYIELFRSSPDELMRALGLATNWQQGGGGGGGAGGNGVIGVGTDAGIGTTTGAGGGGRRYNVAPKSTCVLMRGLPYSCTESDITKFFQEIDVTPIRIHRKADGAEAYVEFYSINDTDKAMTRHRHFIGRRYIELFRVTYEDMARTVGLPIRTDANGHVTAASLLPTALLPTTATGGTATATATATAKHLPLNMSPQELSTMLPTTATTTNMHNAHSYYTPHGGGGARYTAAAAAAAAAQQQQNMHMASHGQTNGVNGQPIIFSATNLNALMQPFHATGSYPILPNAQNPTDAKTHAYQYQPYQPYYQ
eukprot:CAMPEP_0202726482 /NCGR_PEP_ID=MMETSP1385-20130828/184634_1 /ASSEMBLY_ACC=CAM_ASM_000861 /TAXON_ID=933848 /ORGANISM="Elphidium margaritaceum" /LENGTH=679 /DNA_ID=CAMNT_0049392703 /DNA_START=220 /DNA_END=2262 /DNA_ORIENTATION=+